MNSYLLKKFIGEMFCNFKNNDYLCDMFNDLISKQHEKFYIKP